MVLLSTANYPFTSRAKKAIAEAGITPGGRLVEKAKARVLSALKKGEIPNIAGELSSAVQDELASYALARMLISALGSRFLANRYAVAEAKRVGACLRADSSDEKTENIEEVARDLGVKLDVREGWVSVASYLKFAPRSVDYKLINKRLARGKVRLSRNELIRVLEEAVRIYMEGTAFVRGARIPEIVQKAAEEIRKQIPAEEIALPTRMSPERFPPCVKKLLSDLKNSENLPHTARWALAVFLLNVGLSVDEIVKIFADAPDFNEQTTRYQVEHAKRRGYKMPSCAAMDSYTLCVADCGVKNPLRYRGK